MKNNRLKFNGIIICMALLYIISMIVCNVTRKSINVATVGGSYADEYAKKHNLQNMEIADSYGNVFDYKYETFEYDITESGTICVDKYNGISSTVVIPSVIDNKTVTSISKDFFYNSPTIKEVFLPNEIMEILSSVNNEVMLHCYKDSAFYKDNSSSEWKINIIKDSEFVNFSLGDIPFVYNESNSSIEIIGYTGKEKVIVFPSYIDGKPVTDISMNMINRNKIYVFPETITNIKGKTSVLLYDNMFAVEFIYTLVALIASVFVVNITLSKLTKNRETITSHTLIFVSFIYLIFQMIFGILCIYDFIDIRTLPAFVVSSVSFILYLCYVFVVSSERRHIVKVQSSMKEKTSLMRSIKLSMSELLNYEVDDETKKCLERLIEDIKYSPLESINESQDMEKNISDEIDKLKLMIGNDSNEKIVEQCNIITILLRKRNSVLKMK